MTRDVTAMLGIRYPIVQGGMQWVGLAQMAAAVSNAGGLGMLTALTQPTPEDLGHEIDRCRALTPAPFGVNVTMLRTTNPPPYERIFDVIIERGVPVVETSGNVPDVFLVRLRRAGIRVIHKCTSVRHAMSAERRGVDIVSIDGFECAGHPGEDDVPGLVLIPAAARALNIPVLAAGGIADGRGLAAALCLGASGVTMGTRFLCTLEAPVHDNIKHALVAASECDTRLIMRTLRNSARVYANPIAEEVLRLEGQPGGAEFAQLQPWVAGARGRAALQSGQVDDGLIWAGVAVGLIHDVPDCDTLVRRMVAECAAALEHAAALAPAGMALES